ncbi:hypothetical protein [Microbulbifer sp. SSSA005]|uniref:hypothetical protein n=1 Tax=Microbulbifer sp. SSSA005 TaxID=3243378 RepID=UPI004039B843
MQLSTQNHLHLYSKKNEKKHFAKKCKSLKVSPANTSPTPIGKLLAVEGFNLMKKISAFIFSTLLIICGQANAKNTLEPGTWLQSGEKLVSNNGRFELIMQTPGNLVLYKVGTNSSTGERWQTALWATRTGGNPGNPGAKAFMQRSNGQLVVYTADNKPLWVSGTAKTANKDTRLFLMDTGNLVLLKPDGTPIWHTDTGPKECKTENVHMWGGSIQYGVTFPSEQSCKAYVPLLPSSDKYWAPASGPEPCVISPAYAGKYPQTICE